MHDHLSADDKSFLDLYEQSMPDEVAAALRERIADRSRVISELADRVGRLEQIVERQQLMWRAIHGVSASALAPEYQLDDFSAS